MLALLLVGASLPAADSVTLAWDPSPSPGVAAYRVHGGTNTEIDLLVTNAGVSCTQTVAVPFRARWFFAATAVDTNGIESKPSNIVSWEANPEPPVMHGEPWVRLTPVLERSTNQTDWVEFEAAATWVPATNCTEWFRPLRVDIEAVPRAVTYSGDASLPRP